METKHTPTPWVLEWHKQGYVVTAESKHNRGHIYRHNLVVIGGETANRELLDANAAFIVRACNVHDDMVKLAEAYRFSVMQRGCVEGDHVLDRINDVLAKARGEA